MHENNGACCTHEREHAACCDNDSGGGKPQWIFWTRLALAAAITLMSRLLSDAAGGWSLALYATAWVIATYDIAYNMLKNIQKGIIFDENLLMVVASLGALAIGEGVEGLAVVLLFQIGEWLQHRAAERSRRHISEGFALLPDFANVVSGESATPHRVPVAELEVGDLIVVRAGERVPADCEVEQGGASFDTAALTGESAPRDVSVHDTLLAGFVALDGAVTARVLQRSADSAAAAVERLLAEASKRSAAGETFIRRFAKVYTPIVCAMALAVAVFPPLIVGGRLLWTHRALTFLVVSCPCALVISVPLSYYAGIGGAARLGVMIRGGAVLETLARRGLAVAFDKTGTLTSGEFAVTEVRPADGFLTEDVLNMAAAAERGSAHPIARAIVTAAGNSGLSAERVEERAGYGLLASVGGKVVLAGNNRLMQDAGVSHETYEGAGTAVYVAVDGAYAGVIAVCDTLRRDARAAVSALKELDLRDITLVTGDTSASARAAADGAGICDVRARMLPDGKVEVVEELRGRSAGVVFIGDGINDAPSLATADVGIAMANGVNRLAADAADAVVMSGSPLRVADAVLVARRTSRTVRVNVTFAFAFKAAVLVLAAFGYAPMWAAVAADVGVALLCVANALRLLRV